MNNHFLKPILRSSFSQNFIKNSLCKVSRLRALDRDRNPSRQRRDLRPSRPRLRKTGLETETETKSRDSITGLEVVAKSAPDDLHQRWETYLLSRTAWIVH